MTTSGENPIISEIRADTARSPEVGSQGVVV